MHHIYKQGNGSDQETLLLLHGTGGDENDLLPLADMIDPQANVLSVRGNVDENGMNRFFRRLREGVFDEEDLIFRTKELADFIDEASQKYKFDRNKVMAVGYSNGANIAASLLYHYDKPLKGAVLLHPMVPRRGLELPDMKGLPVFIGAGSNDPICPPEETEELKKHLDAQGADVELFWDQQGHQLTRAEIDKAKIWYEKQVSGADPS
ncbi:alpha/beta hydrolase [Salisediminibacterium selenitireducens]|uniref:Phospholipase/Carboxylesterase n=1 Tax=Bacillus selenitireducens (strain ATCC 700615 / DSM 15326 / MLS10) TaxID=439292 RepID=D6XZ02_BACIE|nr:alpha/beta hydrolase [Salisediminibacterium selenitireducens]ADI00287.1 phospholipase/Carboxylesterase [[Bacillus] selenitireducens MLS10]